MVNRGQCLRGCSGTSHSRVWILIAVLLGALWLRAADIEPPEIVELIPRQHGFGVNPRATLQIRVHDASVIDLKSLQLTVGDQESVGIGDERLTVVDKWVTYAPGETETLGEMGESVTVRISVADIWANHLEYDWNFTIGLETVINERVLDAEALGLTWMSAEGDEVVFSYRDAVPGFSEGDILVGSHGGAPYYLRVDGLEDVAADNLVRAAVVPVRLWDVIDQGSLSLAAHGAEARAETEDAFEQRQSLSAEVMFFVPEDGHVIEGDLVDLVLEQAWAKVTAGIQVQAEFGLGRLRRFYAVADGDVDAALEVRLDYKGRGSVAPEPTTLFGPVKRTFPFRIGIVPVRVDVEFELQLGFEGEAELAGSASAGISYHHGIRVGAELRDGRWNQVWSHDEPKFTPIPLEWQIEGRIEARAYLKPKLTVTLYEAAGVWSTLDPYLEAEGEFQANPPSAKWVLSAGLTSQAGLETDWWREDWWGPIPVWNLFDVSRALAGSVPLHVSLAKPVYSREFGRMNPVSTYLLKYEGFVGDDDETVLDSRPTVYDGTTACSPVGAYEVMPIGGVDSIYQIEREASELHVRPAPLVIDADGQIKTEGNPNPPLTATFTGLSSACDSEAEFDLRLTTTATEHSTADDSPYPISIELTGEHPNYDITLNRGWLRVDEKIENLEWVSEQRASEPSASIGVDGTVHIVYQQGGQVLYERTTIVGEPVLGPIEVFAQAFEPDLAVDGDGTVHVVAVGQGGLSLLYARLNGAGGIAAGNAFGPPFQVYSNHSLSSPQVAIDDSGESDFLVVAAIGSLHIWHPIDDLPPVLGIGSIGELAAYIQILSAWATAAQPRVDPGAERIDLFRLDSEGDVRERKSAYRKSGRTPFPDTIRDLSMDVDSLGRAHLVWRERNGNAIQIRYKREEDDPNSEPVTVDEALGGWTVVGPPELAINESLKGVAWAKRGKILVEELGLPNRRAEIGSDVSLRTWLGFCAAEDGWRVAWVDEGRTRLADVVVKWTEDGLEIRDARIRVSLATPQGVTQPSALGLPVLACDGDLWALIFVASRPADQQRPYVAVYTHEFYGGAYALEVDSELWDDSDYRQSGAISPIQVRCVDERLSRETGNYRTVEGVVADGVTPLLFRVGGFTADKLRFRIVRAGDEAAQSVSVLESLLTVASDFGDDGRGHWVAALRHDFGDIAVDEEIFFKLDGFSMEMLEAGGLAWPPAGMPQEMSFELELSRVAGEGSLEASEDLIVAKVPFKIGKPPVMLVHGYNADGSSWKSDFLAPIQAAGLTDGVIVVNYGTEYVTVGDSLLVPGAPRLDSGYYLNTKGNLSDLRVVLSRELWRQEFYLRRRWAMTRYDVVGHSQGGVLLRMLCADELGSEEGFINRRNFGRGRFRRVITIGSPHNGSRLAFYLMALKEEIDELARRGLPGFGLSQVLRVIDLLKPNLLQPKFNPYDESPGYVRWANDHLPTHSQAKFHLISTAIDHDATVTAFIFWNLGLWTDERLETVLPKGPSWGGLIPRSDGVVDFSSHYGGVADVGIRSHFSEPIAHADAPKLLGLALFGTEATQTDSRLVGERVASLLHSSGSATKFGEFRNPGKPGDHDPILSAAQAAALEAVGIRVSLELAYSKFLDAGKTSRYVVWVTEILASSRQGIETAAESRAARIQWAIDVHSPDKTAADQVAWHATDEVESGVELTISQDLTAQVVVFAMVRHEDGSVGASRGTVVFDRLTERFQGLAIGGLPFELDKGQTYYPDVLGRLNDGAVSDFFVEQPRLLTWSTSNPAVVSVSAGGTVAAGNRSGTAVITAQYGEWTGRQTVTVIDELPEVTVIAPTDGTRLFSGEVVEIAVDAGDSDGFVERVELSVNGDRVHAWFEEPFVMNWTVGAPGDYVVRATAFDNGGGVRSSSAVRIQVRSRRPECEWEAPLADGWYSGETLLLVRVIDPDTGDTATVYFDYSLDSTDGRNGVWKPCGPPIASAPYAALWRSQPAGGLDSDVWLRAIAVDTSGLASAAALRRIRVDNSYVGVRIEPRPGAAELPLDSTIRVQFDRRPADEAGAPLSDDALLQLVELRDSAHRLVPCRVEIEDDGRILVLRPEEPLSGRERYRVTLSRVVHIGENPLASPGSSFTTTFGPPAALTVIRGGSNPRAGAVWDPPVEVIVVDAGRNRVETAKGIVRLRLLDSSEAVLGEFETEAKGGVAVFDQVLCEQSGPVHWEVWMLQPAVRGTGVAVVDPGPIGSFRLEAPRSVTAGAPVTLVATAYDAFGNVKTDYEGYPGLRTGDARAALGRVPGFRDDHQGTRVLRDVIRFGTLGSQWVRIYDGRSVSQRALVDVINAEPIQPNAVAPIGRAVTGLSPRLEATPFADVGDAAHGATQWQVAADARFQQAVWDSGTAEAGTAVQVPEGILESKTLYYWRVRYRDEPGSGFVRLWSSWSAVASFQTSTAFPFVDDFSSDRGWTGLEVGGWERGPVGENEVGAPAADASEGADGNVLAFGLNAEGPGTLGEPAFVVSPPIDCSNQAVVELSFNRWLRIDSSDWAHAEVGVSNDGVRWHRLWQNSLQGVRDEEWRRIRYDASEIAAGFPTVYVRFGTGPNRNALPFCGWNIDDVRLDGGDSDGSVSAGLTGDRTRLKVGETVEVQLWVREEFPDVAGLLAASFDIDYDPVGLEFISPPDPDRIVDPVFASVKTQGKFLEGQIEGLAGVTVEDGVGDGESVVFATMQFAPRQPGTYQLVLRPGANGAVLASGMGRVGSGRVAVELPLIITVEPLERVPAVEFRLLGPKRVTIGDTFEIVAEVRENDPDSQGFLGGAVDVVYDDSIVSVSTPFSAMESVDPRFRDLDVISGTIAESRIDELGGITLDEGMAQDEFTSYLRLRFVADSLGSARFRLEPALSKLVVAYRELNQAEIEYGSALSVEVVPFVGSDDFEDAADLVGSSVSVTGSNRIATRQEGEPDHAGRPATASIWWRWTAPGSGRVSVTAESDGFDTLLAVYRGEILGELSLVAENDDVVGEPMTLSRVEFDSVGGSVYHIAVDSAAGGKGDIELRLIQQTMVPRLQIRVSGRDIILTWPASADGFVMETTESLVPDSDWRALEDTVTVEGQERILRIPLESHTRFYRLRR